MKRTLPLVFLTVTTVMSFAFGVTDDSFNGWVYVGFISTLLLFGSGTHQVATLWFNRQSVTFEVGHPSARIVSMAAPLPATTSRLIPA